MYLLVTATEQEMEPLRELVHSSKEFECLVIGVGILETAISLTGFLLQTQSEYQGVLHFGVTGAFLDCGVDILDVCVAERESLGDFGISYGEVNSGFDATEMEVSTDFTMDLQLTQKCAHILTKNQIDYKAGNFVTVNSVSGTAGRGNQLRDRFDAICENMEGAAVARVCRQFHLPLCEIRCVSNRVEDRNKKSWKLHEAMDTCSQAITIIMKELMKEDGC